LGVENGGNIYSSTPNCGLFPLSVGGGFQQKGGFLNPSNELLQQQRPLEKEREKIMDF
jgi:hypothetical protein